MKNTRPCQIIAAERLGDGILIEFSDRRCALYSASLLYSVFSQAAEIANTEPIAAPIAIAANPARTDAKSRR
jgi:hypothetical protein